jgi:zinc D-Ala-D-Ala carboxypeptidase
VLAALVAVGATIFGVLAWQSFASSSSSATAPTDVPLGNDTDARYDREGRPGEPAVAQGHQVGRRDGAGGGLPEGVTVFDDAYPGVANLEHELLRALRDAATDAADDGVEFIVNSGWRSAEYQNQLLRDAVSEYGSEEEAARWVATADTSAHVSGNAVDIGPSDARDWLSEHGAGYGLCQIYGNEPWHYELRPDAIDDGCPDMYPDPTHDPRMQQ